MTVWQRRLLRRTKLGLFEPDLPQDLRTKRDASMTAVGEVPPSFREPIERQDSGDPAGR